MNAAARGALAALGVAALLAGCQQEQEAAAGSYHPAEVGEATTVGVKPVTFTPDAAEQVDLTLATSVIKDGQVTVPYPALLYDGQGLTWVYTNPSGTTYLRAKVSVARIEGGTVYLSGGLPAGSRVVTVGAAEVYGAELNISGGH